MSGEIVKTESSGQALYRASTDAAGLCREIVLKTAVKIQGRKYVRVEGWQAIAIAHGCIASSGEVKEMPDGGYSAIGTVRRMSDGLVLATAEGYVGTDEVWAKRNVYARRAMAQTRSISRACRSAFAHVVVMIDEHLSTTPAEEVPEGGFRDAEATVTTPAQTTTAPAAPSLADLRAKTSAFCAAKGLPVTQEEIAACTTEDGLRALCRRAPLPTVETTDFGKEAN